ncbi:MAG TPA: site-2 protease family protein [Nocardioidaceae bacterium]|nr:site-2 protease family protein [Nocardioidaceae bacterium]
MQPDSSQQGPRSPTPRARPPGTLRIARIAGVDVLVRASWLLIAVFIAVLFAPRIEAEAPGLGNLAYVAGLAFAVLLYLSVLLHELSHAFAARGFGLPVRSVTLHFLGGVTEIEGEPQTPWREFVVAFVGPLTSLAIGGLAYLAVEPAPDGLLTFVVRGLAFANIVVGLLNLVPGLPLDGGRVLRALVWWVSRRPHLATTVAGWAGRVVAVLAFATPFVLGSLTALQPQIFDYVIAGIIGLFLWEGASQSLLGAKIRRKLPALHARKIARRAIGVERDLPLAEALRRAETEQAGGIIVIDSDGTPRGVVIESSVTATPEERRPWISVGAVSRPVQPGLLLDAGLSGEALLLAMQAAPSSEYVLVEPDGQIFGVLASADVDKAFATA